MSEMIEESQAMIGSVYDIAKSAFLHLPALEGDRLIKKTNAIEIWMRALDNTYYMLLCKERSDYTVFKVKNYGIAVAEIIDVLSSRGQLTAIEKADVQDAWECWVKINDEMFMFYLFEYDFGVIECE